MRVPCLNSDTHVWLYHTSQSLQCTASCCLSFCLALPSPHLPFPSDMHAYLSFCATGTGCTHCYTTTTCLCLFFHGTSELLSNALASHKHLCACETDQSIPSSFLLMGADGGCRHGSCLSCCGISCDSASPYDFCNTNSVGGPSQ